MTDAHPIAVGVLGASGYGGSELIRRLTRHPGVRLVALASRQYLGQPVETCWPQLAGRSELRFVDDDTVIEQADVVFCATPHGATAPLVETARRAGRRVVDLSADHRLPPATYRRWYGLEHPHPERIPEARYGLVELHRGELPGAELLAIPGCNAATAILALAPLAAAGWLADDVTVHIATGLSGAGRSTGLATHYGEINENVKPYKVAGQHRHTAEIELALGRAATQGKALTTEHRPATPTVTLIPQLVPMTRGILATCTAGPAAAAHDADDAALLERYRDYYREDPMVHVTDELPQTKAVWGSDRTLVTARRDPRSGRLVAFAATDNLGKGAAGQAVQAFNVANGFAETTALELEGRWP